VVLDAAVPRPGSLADDGDRPAVVPAARGQPGVVEGLVEQDPACPVRGARGERTHGPDQEGGRQAARYKVRRVPAPCPSRNLHGFLPERLEVAGGTRPKERGPVRPRSAPVG
jgi:hypothetical protein